MGCSLCSDTSDASLLGGACSTCGSLPEDRAFAAFFSAYVPTSAASRILAMAPPAPILAHFPSPRFIGDAKFTAVAPVCLPEAAVLRPPHRALEMDITRLSFSDSSFDVILCNHVLPYVRSDFLAMSEVHRCLKAHGVAFLSASVAPGKSQRAGEGSGQPGSGQEWRYGEDYFERLEAAGLFVKQIDIVSILKSTTNSTDALARPIWQVACFKYRDSMEEFLSRLAS